ncbi:1-(5-phosphoribosyl)-5-[(5-phosphoribosylamino) methylideneamino] imidazole-4-carboxamide isomerase [Sporosarcina sp. NCCP-2222]|uniref:1-(5-phosphoribosyl)-5-[(5- phosphoribosylamino)methylideneamino]imidazole-4- carboxamide isomerase n=1 Tax=Sporosarcina sp. NCCP-2222 TaxID=2935073 RepID=UPI002084ACD3|nr:1-(5-phosphoribosyl)-5-[(5-phosphoribosylamino)methylideneamino]imidazole-4-carboxamide isomerase [Sporosarcina sp. NCCP-2222]GKV54717.1 1-(5-phosphoribosyl)-5-[(5-phosphoribosylamino) methylideneamino] imidazole-4-carboxamide isomerase [Sporosarcina sp. NCCP-2222]
MILFPAIDIRGGNCVRLLQGNYEDEVIYHHSPVEMAKEFEKQGAEFIHIVDLDGARSGETINQQVIQDIAAAVRVPVQVGGGIRSLEVVKSYLNGGVNRVIIGTAAIENRTFLREAAALYEGRIAVSIDARNGFVATDGWTETSAVKAVDLLEELQQAGVSTVVYTDILKDGMLQGPNFEELELVNQMADLDIIASGGVSTEEDVRRLADMGLYGAIVGKALYEGKVSMNSLQEAISR